MVFPQDDVFLVHNYVTITIKFIAESKLANCMQVKPTGKVIKENNSIAINELQPSQ